MGELAVLKVMGQYLRQGGSLFEHEVSQGIQDLLIVRAGALLADGLGSTGVECSRLLRQLGLDEWHQKVASKEGRPDD